ncbi:MAG: hypothetical protein K6B46_02485 [Opitutales bacterium]|nr:hypothetical protein [Opitutales bacterium]
MQLFAGKNWRPAVRAWSPDRAQVEDLRGLATAVPAFYRALEKCYFAFDWVRAFYDRGKPPALVAHQTSRAVQGVLPPVLRPDLLITEQGFVLCELDSVPGGIGVTASLEREFLAGTRVPEAFFNSFAGTAKTAVVAVSDESAVYRPEMEYLLAGTGVRLVRAEELQVTEQGVFADGVPVDVVYRFFELFDLPNLGDCAKLPQAVERGLVKVLPPMRPFQEEKLSLALFWHPRLENFWREQIPAADLALLKKLVPETWIVGDETAFPPRLENLTQKERARWVLKASGFSPLAWGSRSVVIGADVPAARWERELAAIKKNEKIFYVCQRYRKPCRVPGVAGDGAMARVRICPYYFKGGNAFFWAGTLATFCPPDKKIIHGMSVASLTCAAVPAG